MPIKDTHERYANFYTDFAFKKLFGTEANKELLISFLNALLEGNEVISDLTYLNVEHFGATAANRKAVFDVYCETANGEKILVEMQKAEQEFFRDRSIFYSTFPIQEQAQRNRWNFELKRVYTIGILNFTFGYQLDGTETEEYTKTENSRYRHDVQLVDLGNGKIFSDKLVYIYLEMPKFRKQESELVTLFDKWMYAMKNLAKLMERPVALQEAVFERFFEQAEIAKFNPTEMYDYRESQKDLWDMYSVTETAEKKGHAAGLEEGMAKGMAKGMEQEKLANARKLIANGVPMDSVKTWLDLTEEQVREIIG